MTNALALESRDILVDLRQLLLELDPAMWRSDALAHVRARAIRIQTDLQELLDRFDELPANPLQRQLESLVERFEAHRPSREVPSETLYERWMLFRAELQPTYEAVVIGLRDCAVHVPSLRPTNYTRNVYHVANALAAVAVIAWIPRIEWLTFLAGGIVTAAWTAEILRRRNNRLNELFMRLFSRVSHPHERFRVNSATWYSTALLAVSLSGDRAVMAVAVMVLGVGDPVAAVVGRRWGRIRVHNGRTLEGSLAFAAAAFLVGLATLALVLPEARWLPALATAAVAAIGGAVAELLSRRVDDNFSIPVVSGALAWLMLFALL